ncbi:MAG: hypothetical protein IKC26_08415 [Clostridia bacterium]|nr:hypothetical protein [Clostridia bacterium]
MNDKMMNTKNRTEKLCKILFALSIVMLVFMIGLYGVINFHINQENTTQNLFLNLVVLFIFVAYLVTVEIVTALRFRIVYEKKEKISELKKSESFAKRKKMLCFRRLLMILQVVLLTSEYGMPLLYSVCAQRGTIDEMAFLGDVNFIVSCVFYVSLFMSSLLTVQIKKIENCYIPQNDEA